MEAITSFAQLAKKFEEAKEQQAVSDDAFRASLSAWYLSPKLFGEVPQDPYSAAYKAYQLGIYEKLTGEAYDVANEGTSFNFDHEIAWPYPYGTKSAQTVGTHLMGYGWLIKKLDLPAESRILEIGSGYGALTVHLAQMGYRVTCLDISQPLLDFVQARTAHMPQGIETICGDMATVDIKDTYDALIFNASLHHTLEHQSVIKRLDGILAPGGIVAFLAEPVVPAGLQFVPYPWGIRLDGLSVWSISQWGWMELGFQEPYFMAMIEGAGWPLRRYDLGISGLTDVWIGSKDGHRDIKLVERLLVPEHLITSVMGLRKFAERSKQRLLGITERRS